jgi:UDP-3-O-[3-hydroxymyristoyl] glucosamine N-acyltransferase
MKHSLKDIAALVSGRVVGNAESAVSGIAQLDSATAEDLVFVDDEKYLAVALRSDAGAVIAGEFAASVPSTKPLIIVRYPKLAFARAATVLVPPRRHEPGVHSTVLMHHSVKVGKLVALQPNVVLTEGVVVGDRTRIGPGTAVGENVHIGSSCNIAANVTIYPGVTIGNHVMIHSGAVLGGDGFGFVRDPETGAYEKFPQAGSLRIGDDVEIGCNSTIDRGALGETVIGNGTKLDNMVHIAHNCRIGRNVVIAAQTGISGSCVIKMTSSSAVRWALATTAASNRVSCWAQNAVS